MHFICDHMGWESCVLIAPLVRVGMLQQQTLAQVINWVTAGYKKHLYIANLGLGILVTNCMGTNMHGSRSYLPFVYTWGHNIKSLNDLTKTYILPYTVLHPLFTLCYLSKPITRYTGSQISSACLHQNLVFTKPHNGSYASGLIHKHIW